MRLTRKDTAMPYSEQDHDRALARLRNDLYELDEPPCNPGLSFWLTISLISLTIVGAFAALLIGATYL